MSTQDLLIEHTCTGEKILVSAVPGKVLSTEEDPYGIKQHDSGAKNDSGKPDASLLLMFGRALLEVSAVGTFGAKKYSRGGWQHVPNGQDRYTAALLRHLFKEGREAVDKDIGLLHAAAVAWNALARLELILKEEESDDTPDTT